MNGFDEPLVDLRAEAEGIGAGAERADGGFLDADGCADRAHLERVRDRHPAEAELLSQELLQNARAERRRLVVERQDAHVRGHDRTDAGRDCRPERREPLIQVAADEGELQVRVLRGVAVPGEMFCARGDSPALQAGHEGGDVARDERRLGAEGADPDHRVVRVRVDVRDRREVEVDPDRGQLGANRGCDLLGQREVVDDSEGPVAGV